MENFKYIVNNSVLIRHAWVEDPSKIIQIVNRNFNTKINYITKAIKVNIEEDKFGDTINEGDTLFLSRYINACKKFKIEEKYIDNYDYSSIPVKLIFGRFKSNTISLDNLEMFYDKVLIEPLSNFKDGNIQIPQNVSCNVGKVVKHGKGGLFTDYSRKKPIVSKDDIILFWDNTTTEITLDNKKYLALEDSRIIAKFKNNIIDMDNIDILADRILLKDLEQEKLDVKSNIILPDKVKNNEFELSSNPENKYEIFKISDKDKEVSENVFIKNENIKIGDVIVVEKDFVQYVYFKGTLYYTLDNIDDALCTITM